MVTQITKGIQVSVETEYQPEYSSPSQYHYVFTYKIIIVNKSEHTVKLLNRHWFIHDASTTRREVQGEGVVGKTPTLEPGQEHTYISGCNLKSGMGRMYGKYEFERLLNGKRIMVSIPEFTMIAPFKLN